MENLPRATKLIRLVRGQRPETPPVSRGNREWPPLDTETSLQKAPAGTEGMDKNSTGACPQGSPVTSTLVRHLEQFWGVPRQVLSKAICRNLDREN